MLWSNPPAGVDEVGIDVGPEPQSQGNYMCPKCGHTMVVRKNSNGKYFFGCETWPLCSETRDADEDGNPLPSNFGYKRPPLEPRAATVWERLMWDDD